MNEGATGFVAPRRCVELGEMLLGGTPTQRGAFVLIWMMLETGYAILYYIIYMFIFIYIWLASRSTRRVCRAICQVRAGVCCPAESAAESDVLRRSSSHYPKCDNNVRSNICLSQGQKTSEETSDFFSLGVRAVFWVVFRAPSSPFARPCAPRWGGAAVAVN